MATKTCENCDEGKLHVKTVRQNANKLKLWQSAMVMVATTAIMYHFAQCVFVALHAGCWLRTHKEHSPSFQNRRHSLENVCHAYAIIYRKRFTKSSAAIQPYSFDMFCIWDVQIRRCPHSVFVKLRETIHKWSQLAGVFPRQMNWIKCRLNLRAKSATATKTEANR